MKIATWNIERLKHAKKSNLILDEIERIDADILVLTESDTRINPNYPFSISSAELSSDDYKKSERIVSIHSKFEITGKHETYDPLTAICAEINTTIGSLLVYGTIIGIHGNRRPSFRIDLEKQLLDFNRLKDYNLCIAGDFNLSFSDNYYYTKFGREALVKSFEENAIINVTKSLSEAIDHICLSFQFIENRTTELVEWNEDKTLSDHKGVCVSIL